MDQQIPAAAPAADPLATAPVAAATPDAPKPEVTEQRKQLVKQWNDKIKQAKDHPKVKDAFERMRQCQQIVADGSTDKDWVKSGKYILPIINRHINLAVSTLYAKNPKVVAKRRDKMLFTIWDGQQQTAMAAFDAFKLGDQSQAPILQDIQQGQQYVLLLDRIAKTMEITWTYFMDEQELNYKAQLKAAVRRAKVNAVAYAELDFQRQLQPRIDQDARIADVTSKITNLQYLMGQQAEDEQDSSHQAQLEELQLLQKDLQENPDVIVAEGPVVGFPGSTTIIPDVLNCTNLRTWAGSRWLAKEIPTTKDDIMKVYKVDLGKDTKATVFVNPDKPKQKDEPDKYRVYKIWDRENLQVLTILDGHDDFLSEPTTPSIKIYPFFPIFPLVFNEVESDEHLFPFSDVWLTRHPQDELNRARQGVRDHRRANVPFHIVGKGMMEQEDREKLANHGPNEVIEMNLGQGQDIAKVMQRPPLNPIDPAQYDTKEHIEDIMRSVGTQEANFGPTSGATATETSIAENSRQSSQADNIDDLDEWLGMLARAGGQLLLTELSKERVIQIAGPGAAWPDAVETRSQVALDLQLEIEAGSSGRPNRAAELADIERAAPTLIQIPGINPVPFGKKYLQLLNIDLEEGIMEGLPSIQTINATLSAQARQPAGQPGAAPPGAPPGPPPPSNSPAPSAQGHIGAHNEPAPPPPGHGPQAAHPAPGHGLTPMTHQI